LFAWTLRMYRPNLKSVALSVPEIISQTIFHIHVVALQIRYEAYIGLKSPQL